jgi:hypothetical protein
VLIKTKSEVEEMLKKYEGVLAVKTSDSKISQDEHLDIIEYRMAKGISEKMHEEAMGNLGWRIDRYMNALKVCLQCIVYPQYYPY